MASEKKRSKNTTTAHRLSASGARLIDLPKPPLRDQIDHLSGVVYSQITDVRSVRKLEMSLLIPRNDTLKPAIIFFPGGGFISSHHDRFIELRFALAQRGFVVAAAEYRVLPERYPAPVEDCKTAVRYLRAHAQDYGIDPTRIGVIGNSAGGYLAQMLGLTNDESKFEKGPYPEQSSAVQAVASLYGFSSLLDVSGGFSELAHATHASAASPEALLVHGLTVGERVGKSIQDDPQLVVSCSTVGYLEGKKPPFLIMHGTADKLVSPMQSERLYTELVARGNHADYYLLEGAGHGDIYWFQPSVIDKVADWFQRVLWEQFRG
ncbi:alpha/beta hydrolase [Pseudomonas sp. AF32]|nr:alpha/beta hydrolase [Pseudomonas sp. AF32]